MTEATATNRGRVAVSLNNAGAITTIHVSNEPMYWYDGAWQPYAKNDTVHFAQYNEPGPTIASLDYLAQRTLEQAVQHYGIRAVLFALEAIAERCAEKSVENFNTEQAKQWAAWAVELECICGSSKLKDPGRD